ncbi:MAG: hypothetical protein ACTSVY_15920 [Candidatus Helarchaeota archaeon]
MPVKKLKWYHKLMGSLGKRFYYRKSQKLNLLAVTLIVRNTIEEYKDIFNGSYEEGIKAFEEACRQGTLEVISDMMQQKIAFGVGLYDVASEHVPDTAWAIELGFYALAGKDFMNKIFDSATFIPGEETPNGNPQIIVRFKKCMMCSGVSNSKQKELGNACYGGYFAILLSAALSVMGEETKWGYHMDGIETKCFLKGDDHGEFLIRFIPDEEE